MPQQNFWSIREAVKGSSQATQYFSRASLFCISFSSQALLFGLGIISSLRISFYKRISGNTYLSKIFDLNA